MVQLIYLKAVLDQAWPIAYEKCQQTILLYSNSVFKGWCSKSRVDVVKAVYFLVNLNNFKYSHYLAAETRYLRFPC